MRVDLARTYLRSQGIEAIGEVGDPDPYSATMDAVAEYHPDEIIISTKPASSSGWMRRDLIERITEASGLPVEHVVTDIDSQGIAFGVTLVVANRTASSDELLDADAFQVIATSATCSSSSCPRRAAKAPPRAGPGRGSCSSWTARSPPASWRPG